MGVVNGRRQTVIGVSRIFGKVKTSHVKAQLLSVLARGDVKLKTSELKHFGKVRIRIKHCIVRSLVGLYELPEMHNSQ